MEKVNRLFGLLLAISAALYLMSRCPPVSPPQEKPEINVKAGSTSSTSGTGICDFPGVLTGDSSEVTLTIQNLGAADLELTGAPLRALGGTAASDFSVTSPPSSVTGAADDSECVITFEPDSGGRRKLRSRSPTTILTKAPPPSR